MSFPPTVSVIIPVHNRSKLLREAVLSVVGQEFSAWELIVVDDSSEEDIRLIVEPFSAEDHRIRLLRLPAHSGRPGLVRNAGARRSRGRYLAFLDSDDLWRPAKLTKQLRYTAENGFPLTHTRELWLRDGREVSQRGQRQKRSGDLFEDALRKCVIGPSTVMISRELFLESGGFDEELEIAEDYELWLRLCYNREIGFIDEPLTVKRAGHGDQLSEKYGQIEIFRIEALERRLREPDYPLEAKEAVRLALAQKCRIYANGCEKRGRSGEAGKYYRRACELEEQSTV